MIVTQTSVASETALELVRDARAHAAAHGWAIAVAVVDAAGTVLALSRMDGVAPPIAEFALDKAYTAATMGKPTTAFADRMASAASLSLGLSTRPRLLAWGGGLPIVKDGALIGGACPGRRTRTISPARRRLWPWRVWRRGSNAAA